MIEVLVLVGFLWVIGVMYTVGVIKKNGLINDKLDAIIAVSVSIFLWPYLLGEVY